MTPAEINGWVLVAGTLIQMGKNAADVIRDILRKEQRTEAEINAVLLKIAEENALFRAKSAAIAFGV